MRSGVEETERPRALTTRYADFWLLGGASLLVWLVMIRGAGIPVGWAIDQHFKNLTVTTASLSLLVNYPHFLISYKLAYSRGRSFITAHWWQLIAVPALLIATLRVRVRVLRRARRRSCRSSRASARL